MQTESSRIWTRIAESIYNVENHYTTTHSQMKVSVELATQKNSARIRQRIS